MWYVCKYTTQHGMIVHGFYGRDRGVAEREAARLRKSYKEVVVIQRAA